MTQLTEHTRAILRAIADGKTVQIHEREVWRDEDYLPTLATYMSQYGSQIRIKPEASSINGREFAAPIEDGRHSLFLGDMNHPEIHWRFTEAIDRDTAYQAIVDALEGVTK